MSSISVAPSKGSLDQRSQLWVLWTGFLRWSRNLLRSLFAEVLCITAGDID
jgi:hypothetical protein